MSSSKSGSIHILLSSSLFPLRQDNQLGHTNDYFCDIKISYKPTKRIFYCENAVDSLPKIFNQKKLILHY